jgi:hypothetical protein
MVSCLCWTCGHEREIDATELVAPFCDADCYHEFLVVVEHLAAGGDPAEIDVDLDSRLYSEAVREIEWRRRTERIYLRDVREAQYERNKPKPLRPLYPI